MSKIMLEGVLRMPPDCWTDDPVDQMQRYARYVQAADRINKLEKLAQQVINIKNPKDVMKARNRAMILLD